MNKTVMIVDDEPNIVISLEYLMKREGFQVVVAGDGEEALEKIAQNPPDCVLLDVMLPRKSGFEVCQEIRSRSEWQRIKVIMLTAKGRDAEIQKGIALGADAYVTKPFATNELVATVRRLLETDAAR